MELNSVVDLFTSKTGVIAAILVLVGLIASILKIVIPIITRKEEKEANTPSLSISHVKVEDPPPWSEAGQATFELMNAQGGKAVLSDLILVVADCGKCETPKMVEAAAPIPQFTYKVTLTPNTTEYDVRKKEFGSSTPHSYEKEEIESFLVELRTTEPQWYEFHFLVRWYDVKKTTSVLELKSKKLRIEFKPSIEELLV